MAYSNVLIEFSEVPIIDQQIILLETSLGINITEVFKEIREAPEQTELPVFVPGDLGIPDRYYGFVSARYVEAVNLDANSTGQFTVDWSDGDDYSGIGSVLITANFSGAVFSLDTNSTSAVITIENEVIPPPDPNSVIPGNLQFNVVKGFADTDTKTLAVSSVGDWSITSGIPSWLNVSATSGTGPAVLDITPTAFSALSVGDYNAVLHFEIETDSFDIAIVLSVLRFVENPFIPGNIYFSKALDYLKFSSSKTNTYIAFSIEIKTFKRINGDEVIFNKTYNFPLFKGEGDFHIGSIVDDLFDGINELANEISLFNENIINQPYRPAEITISLEEKSFVPTTDQLISVVIPMFKMVKGYKPFCTENQLMLLTVVQQDVCRISVHSPVYVSFIYIGNPRICVKKNNVIIEDFTITASANEVIYSYFRFKNDLKPGDSIEIMVINGLETRTQRFLVFAAGMESTFFFFENSNQLIESIEFTGRRRVYSNFEHTLVSKIKDMRAVESKGFSKNIQSFIANTGYLTKADHKLVTALVASNKVWCSFDSISGPYFRVDAVTNKLTNEDTSVTEENFDIEFNILENADASIYPR